MSNSEKSPDSESLGVQPPPESPRPLSEAHFRAIAESSPAAVVLISSEGVMLYASPSTTQIVGYQPHELEGKVCFEYVHPDDREITLQAMQTTIESGTSLVPAYRFRHARGGWRWLESIATSYLEDPAVKAMLVHSRDVTPFIEAKSALEKSNSELHSILDTVTDSFWVFDRDWRVLFMNKASEASIGRKRETLLNKVLWDEFPSSINTEFYRAGHRAFQEQTPVEIVDYSQLLDRWFHASIYPSENGLSVYTRDITAAKQAEVEHGQLRHQIEIERSRLNTVLRHLPVGVILAEAPGGKMLLSNEQVASIWRQPVVQSASIADYAEWTGFHPDGRPYESTEWPLARSVTRGEVVVDEEIEILRGDGTRGTITCNSTPLYGADNETVVAGLVSFNDITERKRAEQQLHEETETLEIINELGRKIAAELDTQTLVQAVTDAATELSGAQFGAFFYNVIDEKGEHYTLYTISGVPREMFSHFPMPRSTDIFAHTFNGTGIVRSDDITKDPRYGRMAPYHGMPEGHLPVRSYLAVPVVLRSGEVLGGLFFGHSDTGVFTERAERVVSGLAAQAAIALDNARLFEAGTRERRAAQQAQCIAEEASRTKDEFLAVVSHELRTPLNAILGWAGLINTGRLDADAVSQALDTIERNARSQAQLIEDLLDVSRIMTGNMRMDIQPTQLVPLIEAAVNAVRPGAEAKQIELRMALDPSAGPVSGDATRLQQVIWNLLSNAVKFTPRGGRVEIRLERLDSMVQISVIDSGEGIEPEFLPYVFDRFRQGEGGTTRRHSGLGLGLSIVRHLTELHGGTVRAHSAGTSQGSTFSFELPLLVVNPAERASTAPEDAVGNGSANSTNDGKRYQDSADLSGVRILVVDDEADSRTMLQAVLQDSGAQVRTASSAGQGMEILQEWQPHVLVSDIGMPYEDGYSFIGRVQALEAGKAPQTAAIALTAYARPEDRDKALQAGFHEYLTKPVSPGDLVAAILRAREKAAG